LIGVEKIRRAHDYDFVCTDSAVVVIIVARLQPRVIHDHRYGDDPYNRSLSIVSESALLYNILIGVEARKTCIDNARVLKIRENVRKSRVDCRLTKNCHLERVVDGVHVPRARRLPFENIVQEMSK